MAKKNLPFIKYSDKLFEEKHHWSVIGVLGDGRFIETKLEPEDYETAEEQHEALLDVIRNMRFSDTEYGVFLGEKLVVDF